MSVINQFTLPYATDQPVQFTAVTPTNITGWTIQYTLRQSFRGPALATLTTTGGGILIDDAINGKFTVKFTDVMLSETIEATPGLLPAGSVPGLFYGSADRIDAGNIIQLSNDNITISLDMRLP